MALSIRIGTVRIGFSIGRFRLFLRTMVHRLRRIYSNIGCRICFVFRLNFFFFPFFPPPSFKSNEIQRERERSNRNSRIVFPVKIGEITWKRSLPVTSLRVCFSRPFSYRFSAGNLPDTPHLSLFIWERIRLFFVLYFFSLDIFTRSLDLFFFSVFFNVEPDIPKSTIRVKCIVLFKILQV